MRCEIVAGQEILLQAARRRVGTFRQECLARVVPPGVPPQSPASGPQDPVLRWLHAPSALGEAMSSVTAKQTEMLRPHLGVGSLSFPILLCARIRALMPNELYTFPSLSWESKKGKGQER